MRQPKRFMLIAIGNASIKMSMEELIGNLIRSLSKVRKRTACLEGAGVKA